MLSRSGGMSGPQASIPAPSLKKLLVASSDSNNFIPVIGFDGAVEDPAYRTDEYQVLVSAVPMVAEEADAVGAIHELPLQHAFAQDFGTAPPKRSLRMGSNDGCRLPPFLLYDALAVKQRFRELLISKTSKFILYPNPVKTELIKNQ